MDNKVIYGSVLLVLTVIGHFISVYFNLYASLPVDKAWHLFAGAAYVLFGLYFTGRTIDFWNATSFALFGSVVWEVVEYVIMISVPVFAESIKTISPSVEDMLSDIVFGFIGGMIVLWTKI